MISKISNHWSLMIFQISDISEIQDLEYGVCNFMHLYIYFHHVMTITNLDIIVFLPLYIVGIYLLLSTTKLRIIPTKSIFSRESDSRIANVRLSVRQSPKPLSLYESCLSAKSQPISHHANQPSYQSAIVPLSHHAHMAF